MLLVVLALPTTVFLLIMLVLTARDTPRPKRELYWLMAMLMVFMVDLATQTMMRTVTPTLGRWFVPSLIVYFFLHALSLTVELRNRRREKEQSGGS